VVVDEKLARPILIGRPEVLRRRIERYGLRIRPDVDFEVVNIDWDPRYREFWTEYHRLTERRGVSVQYAQIEMRRRLTLVGTMLMHMGEADGLICGTFGSYDLHLHYIDQVIGRREGAHNYYAMNLLVLQGRTLFICDTYVNPDPSAEQIAEMTLLAAEEIRRFGIEPKAALLSHSSFGSSNAGSAQKMRTALGIINRMAPDLEIEGEMQGDAALHESTRRNVFPNSRLKEDANLLIMPSVDAANISFNLLMTTAGNNITIGPILLGAAKPACIVSPSATVRRLVNMSALLVADANAVREPIQMGMFSRPA
jgi:malate dehydrogenase (oxaloacetate-decarboxylating)(NADP+)